MRQILASMVLVVLLFPSLALGGEAKLEDLVITNGLHYKKFTNVPFTGKFTGKTQGSFRNGKKGGPWVGYHADGTMRVGYIGAFKDGMKVR